MENTRESDDQNGNIRETDNQIIRNVPRHEKLWVWRKAHDLMLKIYRICKQLPQSEYFRLGDQIQRASRSVADNTAEGNSSYYFNDKIKAFYTARKEAAETQNHLREIQGKSYYPVKEIQPMIEQYEEVIRGLNGLVARAAEKRDFYSHKGRRTL